MSRMLSVVLSVVFVAAASLSFALAASAMPAGSVFHSDFDDFGSDWLIRPVAIAPDITQLDNVVRAGVQGGQAHGQFDSQLQVMLTPQIASDFAISLILDGVGGGGSSLRILWFAGTSFLDSERVYFAAPGDVPGENQEFIREFTEFAIPTGADRFGFAAFAWGSGGFGLFDALSVAPLVSIVAPEPSTAVLFGLGLAALSIRRRR